MNPDWNLEPPDDECSVCADKGLEECECGDVYEPDTLEEYYE